MITIPDLQTSLLDLLHEMEGTDVKLIIGDFWDRSLGQSEKNN